MLPSCVLNERRSLSCASDILCDVWYPQFESPQVEIDWLENSVLDEERANVSRCLIDSDVVESFVRDGGIGREQRL